VRIAAAGSTNCRPRLATLEDGPALLELVARSIRELGAAYYSRAQIHAALQGAFGVDPSLIRDGTQYVAVAHSGGIAACGGWGRRRQGLGGTLRERSESDAIRAGFTALELMATLCGVKFYDSCAYVAGAAMAHPLPGGLEIALVPMSRQVRPGAPP